MKTRLAWLAACLALSVVTAGSPRARSARSECLDRQLAGAMQQGWRTRGVDTDSLLPGDSTNYEMSFYKGSRYLFLACTDDTDAKVELIVVDPDGNPVGMPSEKGVNTLLEVKAEKPGNHMLQVGLTSPAEGKPSWFSVATLYR